MSSNTSIIAIGTGTGTGTSTGTGTGTGTALALALAPALTLTPSKDLENIEEEIWRSDMGETQKTANLAELAEATGKLNKTGTMLVRSTASLGLDTDPEVILQIAAFHASNPCHSIDPYILMACRRGGHRDRSFASGGTALPPDSDPVPHCSPTRCHVKYMYW